VVFRVFCGHFFRQPAHFFLRHSLFSIHLFISCSSSTSCRETKFHAFVEPSGQGPQPERATARTLLVVPPIGRTIRVLILSRPTVLASANRIALERLDESTFLKSQKRSETPCPSANETIRMKFAANIQAEKGLRLGCHKNLKRTPSDDSLLVRSLQAID
jgi:hypothetical protein